MQNKNGITGHGINFRSSFEEGRVLSKAIKVITIAVILYVIIFM